jgi:2-succinyl-6-hydroxy-2,4-cyclohexadiene-1-carboxylate synthase
MPGTESAARLHHEVDGAGQGSRVVLAHGFTQTRRCWGDLPARLVGAGHEVFRVDLPGHGQSNAAGADLWETADLLVATGGHATYLGYSSGARVCLHAALAHREQVRGLVLVGGTPGLADPDERAARFAEDEQRATRVEEIGVPAFLDEWLALPLFDGLRPEDRCLDARLENDAAGLAASLRRCGTGAQDSLWGHLPELTMPVLCVAGARDAKFAAIARAMAVEIGPPATVGIVADAGHTAHLEQPDAFWSVLEPWLIATQPNRWYER